MYLESTSGLVSLGRNVVRSAKICTTCRVCGATMEALHRSEMVQTNNLGQTRLIPDSTVVTCKNPSCKLVSFSFEAKTYHAEDLTPYGVRLGS